MKNIQIPLSAPLFCMSFFISFEFSYIYKDLLAFMMDAFLQFIYFMCCCYLKLIGIGFNFHLFYFMYINLFYVYLKVFFIVWRKIIINLRMYFLYNFIFFLKMCVTLVYFGAFVWKLICLSNMLSICYFAKIHLFLRFNTTSKKIHFNNFFKPVNFLCFNFIIR